MAAFSFRGSSFEYSDSGNGRAIIFLHGFLENLGMWDDISRQLPASYRKISLDLPGHGASENLAYVHRMEDMAELVNALMEHLKIRKAFLVGHSMGGYVALAFGDKYPEKIRGVVLMNSSAKADTDQKKKDRNRAIALVKENHKAFIRNAIPMLFRPKNRSLLREDVNRVKAEALKTSKRGVIAALEGMKIREDRELMLQFAPYDFLFIAARYDPVIPFAMLEEQLQWEKVIPVVSENGHMGHLEDPALIVREIKGFLRKN